MIQQLLVVVVGLFVMGIFGTIQLQVDRDLLDLLVLLVLQVLDLQVLKHF